MSLLTPTRFFRAPSLVPRLLSLALASALGGWSLPVLADGPDIINGHEPDLYRSINPFGLIIEETARLEGRLPYALLIDGDTGFVDNRGIVGMEQSARGLYVNRSMITELRNAGTIQGGYGLINDGTIATLTNTGTVTGFVDSALLNMSNITSLENRGLGVIDGKSAFGAVFNQGTIDLLFNDTQATIKSEQGPAVVNHSMMGTLRNAGTMTSASVTGDGVIQNFGAGTINTIDNSGTILGETPVRNEGQIGRLINAGSILGRSYSIVNTENGRIQSIRNSGKIVGTIENLSTEPLTLMGGPDRYGSFAGFDGAPMIVSPSADVVFSAGKMRVAGDMQMEGNHLINTVRNTGAQLRLAAPVKIIGNYYQGEEAALELDVQEQDPMYRQSGDTHYGRLIVSNDTTIEARSSITLHKTGNYAFAQGQRYVAVSTSGSAQYNVETIKASAEGYTGSVDRHVVNEDGASHLVLTLRDDGNGGVIIDPGTGTDPEGTPGTTPGTGGNNGNSAGGSSPAAPRNPATTSNASSALGGLFNYQGVNQDLLNVFNPAAALGSTSAANRAGAQLAPSAVKTAASQGAQRATAQSLDIANARLDSMRSAPTGATGVATGETGLQPAMWGQYFGGRARQSERDDVAGYDARFNGLLMGADTLVSENWRVGGMFSYARTNVDNKDANDGSEAKVDSYGLTAYAGYDGRPWYVNVMAGVVRQRYETERDIAYTGFAGHARGKHDGTQYVTSVLAGYPIALTARTTLTPLAGLSYSHLRQDGYTESGGNGAGLKVGSTRANSLKSDLGVKVEHAFDTSIGLLTPSAQLRWRHEFQNSRVRTASSFAADPTGSTAFTSLGATPVKDTGVFVLGATLATNDRLSIGVNYTLEAARGYTSQTGDLRVRYAF